MKIKIRKVIEHGSWPWYVYYYSGFAKFRTWQEAMSFVNQYIKDKS